jgi:hypothetical protein
VCFCFALGSAFNLLDASTRPPNIVCGRISDLSASTFVKDAVECSVGWRLPDDAKLWFCGEDEHSLGGVDVTDEAAELQCVWWGDDICVRSFAVLVSKGFSGGTGPAPDKPDGRT